MRRFLLLIVGLIVALPLSADFLPTRNIIDDALNGSWDVAVGDIDGDGDLDVAGAGHYDDTVLWYENINGTLQNHIINNAFDGVTTVEIADMNNDGRPDVVATAENTGEVAWFSRIDATTWTKNTVGFIDNPAAIRTGDIDNDGDRDVVVAGSDVFQAAISLSQLNGEVAWFENTSGDGRTWSAKQSIDADFRGTTSVDLGDVDGDGDLDVVSTAFALSAVAWFENLDGQGDFSDRQIVITGDVVAGIPSGGLAGVNSVIFSDVDGDGDPDVVASATTIDIIPFPLDGGIFWFENNGVYDQPWPQNTVIDDDIGFVGLTDADMDRDGDQDIVAVNPTSGEVGWYENLDALTWAEGLFELAYDGAIAVAVGDINGDGDLDVFSAASDLPPAYGGEPDATGRVAWWENTMGGERAVNLSAAQPIGAATDTAIATADLDTDGDPDLLTADDTAVNWFANTDGLFGIAQPIGTAGANALATADLDGDGNPDLLTADDTAVNWFANAGGIFGTAQAIGTAGANALATADLDGDGNPDLLTADDTAVNWFANTDGLFGIAQPIGSAGADALVTADLDGDGDPDLLTADDTAVNWFANANGVFSTAQAIGTAGANALATADLDGDGDLDLLTASDTAVNWFANTGGVFGTAQPIGTTGANTVTTTDLDGDGDLDVLLAGDMAVGWHTNTGGTFGAAQVIANTGATALLAVDLDVDGDPDVLTNGAWYENRRGPGIVVNMGMTVPEDITTQPITAQELKMRDNDTPTSGLVYTLTTLPNGQLLKNNVPLAAGGSFSQADVDNGLLAYTPVDADGLRRNGADSFDFTIQDDVTVLLDTYTFNIVVEGEITPTPTNTPTDTPTTTPTATPTPTSTPTATPTATNTATPTTEPAPTDQMYVEGELNAGSIRPTFVWLPQAGTMLVPGDWYELVLNQNGANTFRNWFQASDVCNGGECRFAANSDAFPVGLTNGSYEWYIRTWNTSGVQESQTDQFTVNTPLPNVPAGFTVNTSAGYPVVNLPYDAGTGWLHVHIQDSTAAPVYRGWHELNCTTNCQLPLNTGLLNGQYTLFLQAWGAAGYNGGDQNLWSNGLAFTLNTPAAGAITNPTASVNGGTLTIGWQAAPNTTWYQIWVGTDAPSFTTLHNQWYPAETLGCATGGTCQLVLENLALQNGVAHVWYIRTWGPGGFDLTLGTDGWQRGQTFTP